MPADVRSHCQSSPVSRGQPRQQGLLDSYPSFGRPETPAASLRRPVPDGLAKAATAGAYNNTERACRPSCSPSLHSNSGAAAADPLQSMSIDLDDILPPEAGHQATTVLNTVQAYETAMLNTVDIQGSSQSPHRVTTLGSWDSAQRTVPLPESALSG